jgi:hypothetical protein
MYLSTVQAQSMKSRNLAIVAWSKVLWHVISDSHQQKLFEHRYAFKLVLKKGIVILTTDPSLYLANIAALSRSSFRAYPCIKTMDSGKLQEQLFYRMLVLPYM